MNLFNSFLPLAMMMAAIPNIVVAAEIDCLSREFIVNEMIATETQCREIVPFNDAFDQAFYSHSPAFLDGVSIPNTLADILGFSFIGNSFLGIKALGFPEQKIGWDGLALDNRYNDASRNQVLEYPINTKHIGNGFCSKLPISKCFND